MLHMKQGGGDGHINNSVFLRFGFDDFKVLRKLQNDVKDKATKTRVGYVVSIQPMLCSLAYGVFAR